MAAERARFIPELLDVHAESLAFLWGQRRAALYSPRQTLRELAALDERIEAHLQGLLIAPVDVLGEVLKRHAADNDRDEAFAAAYALLRWDDDTAARAVAALFLQSTGPRLAGLRDAMSFAPLARVAAAMQSALDQAPARVAASAAIVLANHHRLDGRSPRLARLLEDDDAEACALAWQAALLADAVASHSEVVVRPYRHALKRSAPSLRRAAWAAGAWGRQAWVMPTLREAVAQGDAAALHGLAVLGGEDDVALLQKAALALDDGTARCTLLARFGHPSALNALIRWMADTDVALAAAAGEAFTRITGADIRGERRPLPVAGDADDFAREMTPDVWLPDLDKARGLMERHAAEWNAAGRWSQGIRVDGEVARGTLVGMDFEARWDIAARAALSGQPVSVPAPIY
jgi:uncharacterized protein (TIGR02270 family)